MIGVDARHPVDHRLVRAGVGTEPVSHRDPFQHQGVVSSAGTLAYRSGPPARSTATCGSVDHFGGVSGHGLADVGGVEQPLVVDGEFAQVAEVLDIQVRGERAHEPG
jgi:hypothetical protein